MDDTSPLTSEEELQSQKEAEEAEQKRKQAIIDEAKERFKQCVEAEAEIRKHYEDDLKFRSGEQWPDEVKNERANDGRPCLVVNRLPQIVQQITNDQRQNRPAIKVRPLGDGASEETAEVFQGLIRHIADNSNAEVARDTAFECMATGGYGYYRVVTDYKDPQSFDQEIYIKAIPDPLSVYFDRHSRELDGSDANFCFVIERLSKDEYTEKYSGSELATSATDWKTLGADSPEWISEDSIQVAEYLYKDYQDQTIHLLATGETVTDDRLAERQASAIAANLPAHIVRSRQTRIPVIKWCKLNGSEILEETVWPGSYIPVIPVYGARLLINGKRVLEGVIRNAKDPQRAYNYWKSAQTEAIALAPKAPFIGAEGQFEGHEDKWASANKKNHAYLEYKATNINGQPVPPPQRNAAEPAVMAITQAMAGADDDLRTTTGHYPSVAGDQSNEIAGVAIQARNAQSQNGNFHLVDNLKHSIRHEGRILVDLIPKIYDAQRTARILHEDGSQKLITVNGPTQDDSGQEITYALSQGKYDVTVDTGPSYQTKRQEAAAAMIEFTRALPQAAQFITDLIARNMDWPGHEEMADRFKKLLPPALQDNSAQAKIPPQVQAQVSQMQMMIKQLSDHLNESTKIIETKQLELSHKERVELMHMQLERERLSAEIEMNLAKLGNQSSIELMKQEIGAIKHENKLMNDRLKLLGINQPIDAPNDFNPQDADGGNYAGFGHVGSGPTGGPSQSPGTPMEGNP